MPSVIPKPVAVALKKTTTRLALAFAALQATVIAGLVVFDALKRLQRTKRSGFPRPGTFDARVADSDAKIYTYGEDLYADMIAAIDGAEEQVLLETYIWKSDATGRRFKEALNAAARRGVDVFVIYDGFANLVVPPSFYDFDPDIHVYRFPVVRPSRLFTPLRSTGLDHRKLLVVDGQTGFAGGYNIGDLYATEWRDTHLRVQGPATWELRQAFLDVWNTAYGRPEIPYQRPRTWDPHLRAANNMPSHLVYPIRGLYLDAINRASDHIYITTAYFIPDRQILQSLLAASRRGVDVRLIVPEDSNHVLADWLARGFFTAMLKEGITVLLYRDAMIHAKTATIDGQWSTIGTANIDRLSLTGNYETNLEIHSEDIATRMREIFDVDSGNCRQLTLAEWKRQNPAAKFSELVLIPLRPFL
ncbi:phosphatidylserine/phosphatidylglycerophosphate/cardiolipin synthase family protein [Micrococcaceae bacterium RIT802]|nr:phosphatidylserine/phosphatidylglycerophosphate/cardiolipin synthase family protein [Micrococcaceae bacterium RIT 802]